MDKDLQEELLNDLQYQLVELKLLIGVYFFVVISKSKKYPVLGILSITHIS